MNKLEDMLKFRYVAFDFDNTLAGHTEYGVDCSEYKDEIVRYLQHKDTFRGIEVSEHLKKCMDFLGDHGVQMGLCSAIGSSQVGLKSEVKVKWVKDNYGHSLMNICVREATDKSLALSLLQEAFGCNADEILIIDDLYDVLDDCASKGFSVCTPMHIVNLVSKEE